MALKIGTPVSYDPFAEDTPDQSLTVGKPISGFTPEFEEEPSGDFVSGVKRGFQQLKGSLYGASALVGSAVGSESLQEFGMEGYKESMAEAEKNKARYSFKDVYTGEAGVGGAIDWAQGTIGELLPSMAEAAIGAAIGSVAAPGAGTAIGAFTGRTVLKKSIQKTVADVMEKRLAKGLIEEGTEAAVKNQIEKQVTGQALKSLGGKIGMGAAVLPMEAGSNYAGLLEEKGVDAPATALFFGALSTSLEYAGGNSRLVDTLIKGVADGKGSLVKRAAKNIIRNMGEEGAQEGAQEALSILNTVVNTDEKFLTPETLEQIIEAAGAGALGGAMGGVAETSFAKRPDTETPPPTDTAPAVDPAAVTIERINERLGTKEMDLKDVDEFITDTRKTDPELALRVEKTFFPEREQEEKAAIDEFSQKRADIEAQRKEIADTEKEITKLEADIKTFSPEEAVAAREMITQAKSQVETLKAKLIEDEKTIRPYTEKEAERKAAVLAKKVSDMGAKLGVTPTEEKEILKPKTAAEMAAPKEQEIIGSDETKSEAVASIERQNRLKALKDRETVLSTKKKFEKGEAKELRNLRKEIYNLTPEDQKLGLLTKREAALSSKKRSTAEEKELKEIRKEIFRITPKEDRIDAAAEKRQRKIEDIELKAMAAEEADAKLTGKMTAETQSRNDIRRAAIEADRQARIAKSEVALQRRTDEIREGKKLPQMPYPIPAVPTDADGRVIPKQRQIPRPKVDTTTLNVPNPVTDVPVKQRQIPRPKVDMTQAELPKTEAPASETEKDRAPSASGASAPQGVAPSKVEKIKAAIEALGPEPPKPSPESKAFGKGGKAKANPARVADWEARVATYNSWKRQYMKLKKQEVEAGKAETPKILKSQAVSDQINQEMPGNDLKYDGPYKIPNKPPMESYTPQSGPGAGMSFTVPANNIESVRSNLKRVIQSGAIRQLRKKLGDAAVEKLTKAGKIKLVQTSADLEKLLKSKADKTTQGAYDADNDVSYLVLENLTEENAWGVFLHEVGVHAGLRNVLGRRYGKIMSEVERLVAEGDKALVTANQMATRMANASADSYANSLENVSDKERAEARAREFAKEERFIPEETLAYFIEATANQKHSFFKKVISAIRAWAFKMGLSGKLTTDDMISLINGAVKKQVRMAGKGVNAFGRDGDIRLSQKIKKAVTDSPAFKKWFGDSVVTVDGKVGSEPLVVYHGTTSDFNEFSEELQGKNFTPMHGKGFYFAERYGLASEYGRNVMPAYLAIKNPLQSNIKNQALANQAGLSLDEYAKKQGHDGIVYAPKDSDKQYVAFSPTQIKSVFNQGTWDASNPDIRFSKKQPLIAEEYFGSPDKTAITKVAEVMTSAKSDYKKFVKKTIDKAITETTDRLHPIKALLDPTSWKKHVLLGNIQVQMSAFFEHGLFKNTGHTITVMKGEVEGFRHWWDSLGDDGKKLLMWMAAKREEANIDAGITKIYLDKAKRDQIYKDTWDRNSKTAMALNEKFQVYNKNILDMGQSAGLFTAEQRKEWEREIYVPFMRDLSEFENGVDGSQILAFPTMIKRHVTSGIKKLEGSEKKLGNLLENVIGNWSHIINESMRNIARSSAYKTALKYGLAHPVPKKFISLKDTKTLSYMENGNTVYFQVDDIDLFNALSEFDHKALDGLLNNTFRKAKQLLTFTATVSPTFRLKNPVRDTISAYLANPQFLMGVDTIKGLFAMIRKDPKFVSIAGSGGIFYQGIMEGNSPKQQAKSIQDSIDKKGHLKLKSFWQAYQFFGDLLESATRVGMGMKTLTRGKEYLDADLAKGKITQAQYEEELRLLDLEAAFKAKDILNFQMSGANKTVRALMNAIPFLNARIQGLYKLGRGAKEDPKLFLFKAVCYSFIAMTLWNVYKDEDWYKELPIDEKFLNHWFKIGDRPVAIPRGFEVGLIPGAFEAISNVFWSKSEDNKHIVDFVWFSLTQTLALDLPQAIKPAVEVFWKNKSSFTGNPIEDRGMQNLSPALRFEPWTPESMRLLGEKLNVSPLKAHHLVRGYLAALGNGAIMMSDFILTNTMDLPERPTMSIRDYPMIGGFVRDTVARRTKYQPKVWEMMEELSQFNQDLNMYRNAGKKKEYMDLLNSNKKKLIAYEVSKPYSKMLTDLSKQSDMIWKADKSGDWKQAELQKLSVKRNRTYKEMYEKIVGALK